MEGKSQKESGSGSTEGSEECKQSTLQSSNKLKRGSQQCLKDLFEKQSQGQKNKTADSIIIHNKARLKTRTRQQGIRRKKKKIYKKVGLYQKKKRKYK